MTAAPGGLVRFSRIRCPVVAADHDQTTGAIGSKTISPFCTTLASMEDDKLRVPICRDHFPRVRAGNPCATCPSNANNETVVTAMAAALAKEDEQAEQRTLLEIHRIGQQLNEFQRDTEGTLSRMDNTIRGNGDKQGLTNRLTTLETQVAQHTSNRGHMVNVIGIVVANVIAAVSLFYAMSN